MSSKLKKKSKPGYQKFIENRTPVYSKQEQQQDNVIVQISNHMNYSIYLALHDILGFSYKRCIRFYKGICDLKAGWRKGMSNSEELLVYCNKKGLQVNEFVKKIPMNTKVQLALPYHCTNVPKTCDVALLIAAMLTAIVLKETFNVSKAKIHEVLDHIRGTFEAMVKKQPESKEPYITDEDIIQMMKDECGIDLVTGNKVGKK